MTEIKGSHAPGDFLLTRRGVINPNRTIGDEIFDIAERLGVFERPEHLGVSPEAVAGLNFTKTEKRVMSRLVHIESGNSSHVKDMAKDLSLTVPYVKTLLGRIQEKLGVESKLRAAVLIERSGMFS